MVQEIRPVRWPLCHMSGSW